MLLSLLRTVVVGDLIVSTNYVHKVMHEWSMKLLHVDVYGKFNLTINKLLHLAKNGVDNQIIECYDKMSLTQVKREKRNCRKN